MLKRISICFLLLVSCAFGQMTTFDGTDDYLEASPSAYTNDATGTWVIWRSRTSLPVDKSSQGEQMLSYCYNGSANIAELIICDYDSRPSGKTNLVQARAIVAGATKWALEFDSNTAVSDGTPQMIAVVHDGTTPIGYLDGVAANTTFANSNDKTVWVNKFTGVDTVCYGASLYNGSEFYHYDGTLYIAEYFPIALTAAQVSALYRHGTYPLDTDTVVDWSLNGNDAANSGATIAQEDNFWKGTFNGSSDYVTAGDISSDLDATDYYTIIARVKYTAGSGYGHVFRAENNSSPFNGRNIWVNLGTGQYGCYMYTIPRLATATLTAGQWHTISVTAYEHASSGYIRASIDGGAYEEVFSGDTTDLNVQAGTVATVGGNVSSEFFKGDIDYVEFYQNAFTDADISNRVNSSTVTNAPLLDYNFTPAPKRPVLSLKRPAGLYAGGDLVLPHLADLSGNSNNFTNYNGASVTPVDTVDSAVWTADTIGGYYDYDGVNDWSRNTTLNGITNMTEGAVMMWVNRDALGSRDILWGTWNPSTTLFFLEWFSSDSLYIENYKDNVRQWSISSASAVTNLGWTQVVLAHDGTEPYLYVNGSPIAVTTNYSADMSTFFKAVFMDASNPATELDIGAFYFNSTINYPFAGGIGQTVITDVCPTPAEVSAAYTSGRFKEPAISNKVFYSQNVYPPNLFKNHGTAGSSADATASGNPTRIASIPTVIWNESVALDSSGSGNHGTVQSTPTLSQSGEAWEWDFAGSSSGEYIRIPASSDFVAGTNITISVRCKTPGPGDPSKTQGVISHWSNPNGWNFDFNANDTMEYRFGTAETTPTTLASSQNLDDDVYRTVTFTYNGALASMYIDGILDTNTAMTGSIDGSGIDLYLAYRHTENFSDYFISTWEFAKIWKRCLSSNEVSQIGRNTQGSDMVLDMKFAPPVKPAPKLNTGRNR